MDYKFFENEIKVYGKDLEEIFINTGVAISDFLFNKASKFVKRARGFKKIKIEGENLENVLKNYINEVILISNENKKVFPRIKVLRVANNFVEAQLFGFNLDNFERKVSKVLSIKLKENDGYKIEIMLESI